MCDWLNKFYSFPLLLITLAVNRMDGRGHINTERREHLSKKAKMMQYYIATKELPERRSALFIKVSERMRSTTFKRRPAFGLTIIILA